MQNLWVPGACSGCKNLTQMRDSNKTDTCWRAEAVCLPTEGSAGTYNTGFFFSEVVQVEFTIKTSRTWSIVFLHSSFRFLRESSSTFSLCIHHHLSYDYWSFCCCYSLSYPNLSTSCSGSQEHWGREGMWLCDRQCHADHTKTTSGWMCLHKQKRNFIVEVLSWGCSTATDRKQGHHLWAGEPNDGRRERKSKERHQAVARFWITFLSYSKSKSGFLVALARGWTALVLSLVRYSWCRNERTPHFSIRNLSGWQRVFHHLPQPREIFRCSQTMLW